MNVFVYGTLMRGFSNHHVIEKHVLSVRKATIRGQFRVFHLKFGFPGLYRDEEWDHSVVKGELYTVKEEAIPDLDALEEYFGVGDLRNEYEREEVDCEVVDSEEVVRAYVYRCLLPPAECEGVFVEDGDWGEFVTKKSPKTP